MKELRPYNTKQNKKKIGIFMNHIKTHIKIHYRGHRIIRSMDRVAHKNGTSDDRV